MKKYLLAATALLFLTPAFADEPRKDVCTPWADLKKEKEWVQLTNDQWQFVRGSFVTLPNTPMGFPPGDTAYMSAANAEGSRMVIFVDKEAACDMMMALKPLVDLIMKVGQSEVYHVDKGL